MFCELQRLFRKMRVSDGKILAPSRIATHLPQINKELQLGVQQDAHEFICSCLDSIHNALLAEHATSAPSASPSLAASAFAQAPSKLQPAPKQPQVPKYPPRVEATTAIHQIFGGYLQSQVLCTKCGHESNVFDPFLELSLDIV